MAFQVARYAANLGVTMALARLIAPVDFGLFAIAATFTGLLVLFKDGGMETALVRHGAVTESELAALGSLTFFYGLALAAGCALLGPILAEVFQEPRLGWALLLPAVALLFHGLDVVPGVMLLRTHRFQLHAAIETVAILLGWAVTLLLAWRGAGHWALFATEPVTAACLFLGHAWAASWRPRLTFALGPARPFVHFGREVAVIRALAYAARNVDNLILGLVAGPARLAFYNKAFRLIGLPQEAIGAPFGRLAVPLLSGLRGQPAEFVRAFRHFVLSSSALGLPCLAFLLVSTEPIVAVMYGRQWTEVVPLLRLLGLMGLCNTVLHVTGWVYTAEGTVRRQLKWEAVNLAVLGACFFVGARWDATGVAIASSLGYTLLRIPSLLYCFRGTPLRLRDVGAVLGRPALAAAVGAALVLLGHRLVGTAGPALLLVLRDGLILTAGYALGWIAVPGWRAFLRHELRRPAPAP